MGLVYFRAPTVKILYTSVNGDQWELLSSQLEGDLLRVQTNKTLNNPAGSWSITLVARKNLQAFLNGVRTRPSYSINSGVSAYDIFKTMGLIDIYINDTEVMLGIIDYVTRTTAIDDNGKPQVAFTLTGRDLGAFLIDHKIWYEQNAAAVQGRNNLSLVKGLIFQNKIRSKVAHKIIEDIYKIWFTDVLNVTVPDRINGGTVSAFEFSDGEAMDQKLTCSSNIGSGISIRNYIDAFPTTFQAWSREGDIYQFLKMFSSPPFNELYVDTGGALISLHNGYKKRLLTEKKCHVIFRPSPFDDSKIGSSSGSEYLEIHDLPSHTIDDSVIKDKKLGFGRNNISSIYRVLPLSGLIPETQSSYFVEPAYDQVALKRYGHNMMKIAVDSFDAGDPNIKKDFFKFSQDYQKKLYFWFRNNDKFLNGTFTFMGNEEVRVGQKLNYGIGDNEETFGVNGEELLVEEEYERGYYYITGVTQEYIYPKSFTTTTTVSRGVSLKNRNTLKAKTIAQLKARNA